MTDPHDPSAPPPTAATPAAAPQKSGIGGLIATIVVMLLVGGAIGYVVGPKVLDDEDQAADVATTATGATTTTAAAVDPNAWAEYSGTFQASMPEGMVVTSAMYGIGQRALIARPNAGDKLYTGGGLNMMFDRRPDMTPEKELDIDPPSDCPTAAASEPYSYGEFTGVRIAYSGCPGGAYEVHRIAVAVPGGTNLFLSVGKKPTDDDAVVEKALDSFLPEVEADTQVAPIDGSVCSGMEDSPKADWPLSLMITNYTDDTYSEGWLNQETGEVENAQDLGPGYTTSTRYTKVGDMFRLTGPSGAVDYTSTADAKQCVAITADGFVAVAM